MIELKELSQEDVLRAEGFTKSAEFEVGGGAANLIEYSECDEGTKFILLVGEGKAVVRSENAEENYSVKQLDRFLAIGQLRMKEASFIRMMNNGILE